MILAGDQVWQRRAHTGLDERVVVVGLESGVVVFKTAGYQGPACRSLRETRFREYYRRVAG